MTRHQYGPHDPSTVPTTVEVGRPGRYQGTERVPVHPAIVRQREQLNNLAAGIALKAEGQQRALDAHPDDRARVEAAIRRLAATGKPFSANDARSLHGVRGGVVGATFTALCKAEVIRPIGDEVSTDRGTHGKTVAIYIGVAA